jgi:hypothetical protein
LVFQSVGLRVVILASPPSTTGAGLRDQRRGQLLVQAEQELAALAITFRKPSS